MDTITFRLIETISVSDAFKVAEDELKIQLDRLGDDDPKWALVKHLAMRFGKLAARHDGLQVLIERSFHREFAIEEIKAMTIEKREITAEIKRVMDELEGVERRSTDGS